MADRIQTTSMNRRALVPLLMTVFLDLLGLGIVIPIIAPLLLNPTAGLLPMATDNDTRAIVLGLLLAIYPFAQFFGAPILGAWSDRRGRRVVLIVSLLGTAVGYGLFAIGIMTKSLWLLFAARALDGFTGGNLATAQSAIADLSDEKSKARNFGLIGMAFGVGFVIGPYVGGKLADPNILSWFTFATPFWFAAALSIVNVALVWFMFRETMTTMRHTPLSLFTGFRNIGRAFQFPKLRTMFLVAFLFIFGFNFFTQFFQVYLIDKFHLSQSRIGDIFAYVGLWIAIAQGTITRPLARRFRPDQILRWSLLGLAVALPMLLVPPSIAWLLLAIPFVAIFNGLTQPNSLAVVSNQADRESQGEIIGINQSIQSLAMTIPPIISGFIVSIDRSLPIIVAGASVGLAWLVFIMFFHRSHDASTFHEVD